MVCWSRWFGFSIGFGVWVWYRVCQWDPRVGLLCCFWSPWCVVSVTGWRQLRGLPLAQVDSVASLLAPLSGQNLVSVLDLYK